MLSISQYSYELDKKEIIHMYLTLENIFGNPLQDSLG